MMVRPAGTDFFNFLSLTQNFSAAVLSISQAWMEGSLLDMVGRVMVLSSFLITAKIAARSTMQKVVSETQCHGLNLVLPMFTF